MYYECCICKSSRQDVILHHFPCTEFRLNIWLECIKRDDLKKLSPEQLSKLFVCQKHFEKKFITSKSRLAGKAYPSLFTDDEISSGISSQENTENVNPQFEHSYSRKRHFDHTYCQQEPLKDTIASGSNEFLNLPGKSENPPTTSPDDSADPGNDDFVTFEPLDVEPQVLADPGNSDFIASEPLDVNPQVSAAPGNSDFITSESLDVQPQVSANPGNCIASEPLDVVPQVSGLNKVKHVQVPKTSRKRLFNRVKDLSPTCRMIYNEYKKAKQQTDFYRRANKAMKLNKEKMFEKLTANMNPYAKIIMNMQINLCTKNKKERRFTLEEKLIALSIMKQSIKCYKFLQTIFILPSRLTLNKMMAKLNAQNTDLPTESCQTDEEAVFQVASLAEKNKLYSELFDEMPLE